MWDSWGGPPTTRFLRHDNEQFNPATRARIHAQLRALGLRIPTTEEEKTDQERALDLYASAVDDIRRLTRDSERFHLVYKGNIEYGFRRNLLGLKPVGLAITALALVASGWFLFRGWLYRWCHSTGTLRHYSSQHLCCPRLADRGSFGDCSHHRRPLRSIHSWRLHSTWRPPLEHREIPSRGLTATCSISGTTRTNFSVIDCSLPSDRKDEILQGDRGPKRGEGDLPVHLHPPRSGPHIGLGEL